MRTIRQFATTQHDVRADFLYGDGTGRYGASNLYAGLEKASSGQEVAKAGACAIAVLQQDWG